LCALQVGLGDLQLLVELGGFDGGHEFTGLYLLAEIDEPVLYVAAGAGVDGRIVKRLRVAGESDLRACCGDGWKDDADGGCGVGGGGVREFVLVVGAFEKAEGDANEDDDGDDDDGDVDAGRDAARDDRRGCSVVGVRLG
jgi:hypothetical protein